ncbi:MAG: hypothetical protein K2Y51_01775 [Gammaproteobacteria bacterium]|nr:hypothetical protein [Gammaproteobacteria bacterium]
MLPLPPAQALLCLTAVLCVGGALEDWLATRAAASADADARRRRWRDTLSPLARFTSVAAAVLITYPAIFGLRAAASLMELLRLAPLDALGLMIVLPTAGLLAARLPWTARRAAAVFTVQGCVLAGSLFDALRTELGALSASAWPSPLAAGALLGLALLLPRLAGALGRELGGLIDRRFATLRLASVFGGFYERLASAAVLTLYGYLVGQQLGI